ncbi:YopX family protein [Levilactobacillus brevis]|uniref:YopX family protein n=1 Tax=Levilactobacillus brevis TaxID=1580 RepID=UPI00201383E4|nr:YopX family protein [Levilactobacillus brevis]
MVPKFRVWNKIDSEYIDEINAVMSLDGSHIWWDIHDSGEMKYEDNPDNYELEQSTGIKDVNGKEIYEGDILEYYYETRGQTFYDPDTLGAVCGEPGIETTVIGRVAIWPSTGVVLTGIKAKYPEDFDSINSDIPKTLHVNRHFEVVGNVHENPELLEAQHD